MTYQGVGLLGSSNEQKVSHPIIQSSINKESVIKTFKRKHKVPCIHIHQTPELLLGYQAEVGLYPPTLSQLKRRFCKQSAFGCPKSRTHQRHYTCIGRNCSFTKYIPLGSDPLKKTSNTPSMSSHRNPSLDNYQTTWTPQPGTANTCRGHLQAKNGIFLLPQDLGTCMHLNKSHQPKRGRKHSVISGVCFEL